MGGYWERLIQCVKRCLKRTIGQSTLNFDELTTILIDVMVESHNIASLIVSWRPPVARDRNGPITGYMVNYVRVGSNNMTSMIFMNETMGFTDITISGLVTYANYSVTVTAMTVKGTGPFSNRMVGRSGEDGKLN